MIITTPLAPEAGKQIEEAEEVGGGEGHDEDDELVDPGGAALDGQAGGQPGAEHVSAAEQKAYAPIDLIVAGEDEQRGDGEDQDDDDLYGVGADQVVANGEDQGGQHEDADAGLDEAAIHADEEHDDGLLPGEPAGQGQHAPLQPTLRAQPEGEEHEHHHDADDALHQLFVQVDRDLGAEERAEDGGDAEDQGAAQVENLAAAEAGAGHQVLQNDADAIGAIGHGGGQAKENQDRQCDERTAAGESVDNARKKSGRDDQDVLVPEHCGYAEAIGRAGRVGAGARC